MKNKKCFKFTQNMECEFFPCHKIDKSEIENFNCLFCFCPLYSNIDCGGNFIILENGKKDCTNCLKPHFDYDYIINKLR